MGHQHELPGHSSWRSLELKGSPGEQLQRFQIQKKAADALQNAAACVESLIEQLHSFHCSCRTRIVLPGTFAARPKLFCQLNNRHGWGLKGSGSVRK